MSPDPLRTVGSGDETMVGQADTQKGTSPHMMQIRVQEVKLAISNLCGSTFCSIKI